MLHCNLTPFALREAVEYIDSRMSRVGLPDQTVFSEELMSEIHLAEAGNSTRVINRRLRQHAADSVRHGDQDLHGGNARRSLPGYALGMAGQPPRPNPRRSSRIVRADPLQSLVERGMPRPIPSTEQPLRLRSLRADCSTGTTAAALAEHHLAAFFEDHRRNCGRRLIWQAEHRPLTASATTVVPLTFLRIRS